MRRNSKKVIIPYASIERIIEILSVVYNKGNKEITINELASLMGCGVSNIGNITPTLRLLGLGEAKSGTISLTDEGMEFVRVYKSGEEEKAKKIIRNGIERSDALKFVKSLMETRVQLTGEEIGRALADRFGKKWKNIASYRTFGNSCASIVGFSGFGFYQNGLLSLKPIKIMAEPKIYAPELGFEPIYNLLNALYTFKRAKISDLAKKLDAKDGRIASELGVCVFLDLVERDSIGSYRITETGSKLVNPSLLKAEKSKVFRKTLLSSSYKDLILTLSQAGTDLTYKNIGENLAFFLRREWSPQTTKTYGKKFVSWLMASELIEKKGPNNFRMKTSEVKEVTISENKKEKQIEATTLYEIGRTLGILETLNPNEQNKKKFGDKISVLKTLLKEHDDLKLIFEMLKENFHLSLESKNSSIYKNNIEFVRKKIKERLGM